MPEDPLRIEGGPDIPMSELTFRATRSGGPGGQHVNTSATRVELTWDVKASPSLSDAQRARILKRLSNRIDASGVLRLVAGRTRSQHRNREEAAARFADMIAKALRRPKKRKKTRPPRRSKEKRLRQKKRRGELKKLRGRVDPE